MQLISGSRWKGVDGFPAPQIWADDVEEVLSFLQRENHLTEYFSAIQKAQSAKHRDARLAEVRAAFYLAQNGFQILQWEPLGEGRKAGEFLVSFDSFLPMFVEVKQPAWEGEFLPLHQAEKNRLSAEERERRFSRIRKGKFIPGTMEARAVGPCLDAMEVVRRNILPKFTDQRPNLAIVMDNFMVTAVGFPGLAELVEQEFLHPNHDPDDPLDCETYERLGGALFLQPEADSRQQIYYRADFIANPNALPACALPLAVIDVFSKLRNQSERRDEQEYI
jgi:hypothetical protein